MPQIYRADWHDYRSRCIYMVTAVKRPGVDDFGALAGDHRLPPGTCGSSYISYSAVGRAIRDTIARFPLLNPGARVLQYAIMPDHLHLLLFVERPCGETLGQMISRFKVTVNNAAGVESVFAPGFNDQILRPGRSLDTIYRYLRENPWRLAVRRATPDYFRRTSSLLIDGRLYSAYGNMHLLGNPFKEAVVVHRRDTPAERTASRARWLYTAEGGGVLVSPFISPDEKAVRADAEAVGGRIILITDIAMGERYKPHAHDFERCCRGRLLIISTGEGSGDALTRADCVAMNALAATIAKK